MASFSVVFTAHTVTNTHCKLILNMAKVCVPIYTAYIHVSMVPVSQKAQTSQLRDVSSCSWICMKSKRWALSKTAFSGTKSPQTKNENMELEMSITGFWASKRLLLYTQQLLSIHITFFLAIYFGLCCLLKEPSCSSAAQRFTVSLSYLISSGWKGKGPGRGDLITSYPLLNTLLSHSIIIKIKSIIAA